MMRRNPLAAAVSAAAMLLGLWAGTARAHEGHDHGDEAKSAPAVTAPRGMSSSDAFELVAVARNGALTVFVDRTASNEPVTGATVQAETPDGPVTATPMPDGAYRIDAHWSEKPGAYDLTFTVTLPDGTSDVFPVELEVPEPPAVTAGQPPTAWTSGLGRRPRFPEPPDPGGSDGVRHRRRRVRARRRSRPSCSGGGDSLPRWRSWCSRPAVVLAPRAFADDGHDHGSEPSTLMAAPNGGGRDVAQRLPDGSVFVPKPTQRLLTIRTVVTDAERPGPHHRDAGPDHPRPERQRRRAVLGRRPPLAAALGRLPAPRHAGEEGRRARLRDAARSRRSTSPTCASARASSTSRSPSSSAGSSASEKLAATRRGRPDAARRRQAELQRPARTAAPPWTRSGSQPEALIAPVAGVIAEANAVAGQMASPGAMVFQIVDPARLWVEALSFEALAAAAGRHGAPRRRTHA